MNIRELIEQLQAFPPDTPVLVDGYEGGLIEAQSPIMEPVVFNYRNANYAGPHEPVEYTIDPEFDEPGTVRDIRNAVILSRTPVLSEKHKTACCPNTGKQFYFCDCLDCEP